MGGRRGCGLVRRAGKALGEMLGAACLALMMTSLAVPPLPAAERHGSGTNTSSAQLTIEPAAADFNQPLSRDQKILQLLNRITFGPRPGDVERVRQMGIDAFLDQQLHPERIDDAATDARVAELETYSLSTQELFENYPQPKQAVKQQRAAVETAATTGAQNVQVAPPDAVNAMQAPVHDAAMEAPPASQPAQQAMQAPPEAVQMQGPRQVIMELGQEELLRAVYSNRQLQEEMVQFWMNHFNIFAPKGADKWMITSFERDTIRPHALSKFEDLLTATAESPAMLFYLDNWMSATPDPAPVPANAFRPFRNPKPWWRLGPGAGRPGTWRHFGQPMAYGPPPRPNAVKKQNKRGLNENYGRELMELHTLGADGGYTQQDVIEVARALTGWTIRQPRQGGEFYFNPLMHDYGEKVVLGHKIPAGGGMSDGLEVLHILANQPATAHHISLQLCQRFVADNPPPKLVDRAARTFLTTGGDIRAVLKTILTSPEFYSQAAYHAKVKSPLELVASSLRALGGSTDAGLPLLRFLGRMGQPLFQYQAPSGWPDRASTWVDSGALMARMQYAMALATNHIRGTAVDLDNLDLGRDGPSPQAALDSLAERLTDGTLSPETRAAVLKQFAGSADGATKVVDSGRGIQEMAALLIGSPDFQRR